MKIPANTAHSPNAFKNIYASSTRLLESPEFPPSLDTIRFIETSPEPEPPANDAGLPEGSDPSRSRWGALLWATRWVQMLLNTKNEQQASAAQAANAPRTSQTSAHVAGGKRKLSAAVTSQAVQPTSKPTTQVGPDCEPDPKAPLARPKRVRYYYDPKLVDEARKLHEEKVPLGEIARKLSIQRRTLNRWLGLEMDLTQQRESILQLHQQKVPQRDIARQLDLPLPKVVQLLQAAGLVKKREQPHHRHDKSLREKALELRNSGVDNAEIAGQLGLPKGTVSFWISQAGLSAPRKNLDDRQVKALREDGLTQKEIAAKLDVSHEVVAKRLKKQGLSSPQVKYTDEQRAKVAELYHQNLKLKDIASTLNIPTGTVGSILNSLGLKNRGKAPMTEAQKQQATEMRAKGHSVQEIVNTLGFSQVTISKVTYRPAKQQKNVAEADSE